MSDEETLKREEHNRKRKKYIIIQSFVIFIISLLVIFSSITYYQKDKTYYINYNEISEVDYKVYLKENSFYDEEYLGEDQMYVASIIDNVVANFTYELKMDTANVNYEYTSKVDAQLEVSDYNSSTPIYNPIYEIKPETKYSQNSSNKLLINEQVTINYDQFNAVAKSFTSTYDLANAKCNLIVRMHINVVSSCADFENNGQNEFVKTLNIPLKENTIAISESSTPNASKILACKQDNNKNLFLVTSIVSGGLDFIAIIILIGYCFNTRNTYINYSIKVNRIVASYKSFIQKIKNPIDLKNYEILEVESIDELLEIRDTIQSPILMNENLDKTCTSFIVLTNSNIAYVYQIKVDNYDELYNVIEPEPTKEVVVEEVQEKAEALVEVTNKENLEVTEDTSADSFEARLNYSFEAKLIMSDFQTKDFYRQIITFVKGYGIKVNRSWKKERIYMGRNLFATLFFKGKKICVAFPLDPKEYQSTKYRFTDMSEYKKYQNTPALMRVTSDRKVKHVIELLDMLFKKVGHQNKNIPVNIKKIPYKSKNMLIKAGLIKTNNKEEVNV